MNWNAIKYIIPLLLYFGTWRSFYFTGIYTWFPLIFSFAILPLLELLVPADSRNMSAADEAVAKDDRIYDWLIYMVVPLQYVSLIFFLYSMQDPTLATWEKAGRITAMGILCGVMGINVGHELGHRIKKSEQFLAKSLLLTSLYMHFFIEHNRGHHKHFGTPGDPSTARYNEPVYLFWFRSLTGVYMRAWEIATDEQKKKGRSFIQNEMLHLQLVQIAFVLTIGLIFGLQILGYFLLSAFMGMLLLETVNYIEHYGLVRKKIAGDKYERPLPAHSWNSNHMLGRIMLFELSRHSDHHYLASRKYQVLRHHDDSPQLPTGYPGSMLLSLVPPLWFGIMNKKINSLAQRNGLTNAAVNPQ